MSKDKKWYLDWSPGSIGYDRDDTILAVGLKSARSSLRLCDTISWLGKPDRVIGDPKKGHVVYFFAGQPRSAALFDVVDGKLVGFGTVIRSGDNAKRINDVTGKEVHFNVLDEMEPFDGSEMEKETEPDAGPNRLGEERHG